MLIKSLKEGLLNDKCAVSCESGIVEVSNSERPDELKKIWLDCSAADEVLLIDLERRGRRDLCSAFRSPGAHFNVCDGIILMRKGEDYHCLFCELKTTWKAHAINQIRNSHLFFNYALELAKAWHEAGDVKVTAWFTVITQNRIPMRKLGTKFSRDSLPNTTRPSKTPTHPLRYQISNRKGLKADSPLPISIFVNAI